MRRRLIPLNWIQWVTLLLVVAVAAGFGYGMRRLDAVQRHENDGLHSIICFAESYVRKSPTATDAQKADAVRFYGAALVRAHLAPCKQEEK